MLITKKQLSECIKLEQEFYVPHSIIRRIKNILMNSRSEKLWAYIKTLRKWEYHFNNRNKSIWHSLMSLKFARKFNNLSYKLGIEVDKGVFEAGLKIYHTQGIVVNGDARVGKNCMLHGANVIGNKGNTLEAPVIGNNVRLGAGAKVLGNVYIADDVQIGAGAVVLNSCYEKGALLVGVPARIKCEKKEQ